MTSALLIFLLFVAESEFLLLESGLSPNEVVWILANVCGSICQLFPDNHVGLRITDDVMVVIWIMLANNKCVDQSEWWCWREGREAGGHNFR